MNLIYLLVFAAGLYFGTRLKPSWEVLKTGIDSIAYGIKKQNENKKVS